ncbi:cysteine hydrolase family protein [Comamonas terrigena]|uniref:cysteine hydrolase family protein n=1 Tax=Comamonas terrigena TaxID=32013 RepID=UPI000AEC2523|nr:cysteine hydrolase family protein [Comamonas terrigena]BBL25262.1 hypothetical protein CT3_27170 [Comamonas terrigena NBRC 13299]SUY71157.1 Isochorismatase family protein yecD [Comamonas terrigena]
MFALLVLDVQVGLVHGPESMWRCTEMLETINTLMAQARRAGAPIFLARHIGPVGTPIGPGSPLAELAPELQLDGSEVVFEKHRPSAFAGTGLLDKFRAVGVSGVVITGMKTQYCVDTSCRAARDMGLEAVLIADGHTCADTPQLRAEQIVAHHNATLAVLLGRACRCLEFPGASPGRAHCRAGTLRPEPRHLRPCGSAPGAAGPVSECRCGVWRAFSSTGYLFSCDGAGASLPCARRPSGAIACRAPCGWWLPPSGS